MNKRQIAQHIKLCGIFGQYKIHTGEFAGLDEIIPVSNATTGFALVRTLRDLAAKKPDLFPRQLTDTPECVLSAMDSDDSELPDAVAAAWDA